MITNENRPFEAALEDLAGGLKITIDYTVHLAKTVSDLDGGSR